jgi:hypothetical protein
MQDKLSQAEHLHTVAEMRATELKELVDTLALDDQDLIKSKYIKAQRNAIALKSNEIVLIRRHSAMANTENHLRKENSTLQADIRGLDKTAKETILRLLVQKTDTAKKIDQLLAKIDGNFPYD